MAKKHNEYNESELKVLFGIVKKFTPNVLLNSWIENLVAPTIRYPDLFDELHLELVKRVSYWNEYELEFHFISPLIRYCVDYNSEHFLVYAKRRITADVKSQTGELIRLQVDADLMLAKGVDEVIFTPYFCFHEYKRTKKGNSDPVAQVLEAMLIAQEMNKNDKPVYGAYVIGKDWYFMVMEGKEYCISNAYQATKKDELLQIIAILREFRVILETTLL
jgi:hypothetical protein